MQILLIKLLNLAQCIKIKHLIIKIFLQFYLNNYSIQNYNFRFFKNCKIMKEIMFYLRTIIRNYYMKILLVTQYKAELESKAQPKDTLYKNHYNRYHKKIYDSLLEKGHEVLLVDGLEDNITEFIKKSDIVFPIRSNYPTTLFELSIYLEAEKFKKKIVGSSSLSKMLECDKIASKFFVNNLGIKTPKFTSLINLDKLQFGKKYIIKNRFASSSIGLSEKSVFIYNNDSKNYLNNIKNKSQYFVEEYIEGIDVSIGIVFAKNKKYLTSVPYTMKTILGNVITFEQKKNGKNLVCCFLKEKKLTKKLEKYAIKIFENIQPCEYTRIDFILNEKNELYFLEYNNTPNLSYANYFVSSLIDKYFEDYNEFISYLICQALQPDT